MLGKIVAPCFYCRTCYVCDRHDFDPNDNIEHRCSKNFHKSAKAVESAAFIRGMTHMLDEGKSIFEITTDQDGGLASIIEQFNAMGCNIQHRLDANHFIKGVLKDVVNKKFGKIPDAVRIYLKQALRLKIKNANHQELGPEKCEEIQTWCNNYVDEQLKTEKGRKYITPDVEPNLRQFCEHLAGLTQWGNLKSTSEIEGLNKEIVREMGYKLWDYRGLQ